MAASPLAAALLGGEGGGANLAAFTDPAIAQATPDLQMAQALLQGGLSTAPASPWQALARVAQTAAGGIMQQRAMGTLAQAYAHTAENAASTLPDTVTSDGKTVPHPLKAALLSSDPLVRMQGLQAYQKAMTLLSEPSNVSPGTERITGVGSNTRPRSELGIQQEDIDNANARAAGGGRPAAAPAARPGVPLSAPPTTIGDVISVSPPQTSPSFNDRSGAARPSGVPPTTPPTNPLQGAIDTKAAMAAATEKAKNPALIERAGASAAAENPALIERAGATEAAKNPALIERAGKSAAAENPALIERAGASEIAKNPALIQRAGGVKQAEATVEYGDLLKPQPAPAKGPGGTEALTTTHGTLVPPLTDQGSLPKTPAEAKPFVETARKTVDGWNSGLQPGYQAEQRLQTIANVFKTMQTGYGAEEKAHVAALLKGIGINLPESVLGDPAKVETAIHENYVETLQQLKATTPRFTQMEFRALSENKEHPNLQPAANLTMLSEDIGQLRQARDLPRDWVEAQRHGWRDPQSFEQAWLRQNPLSGYVGNVRKEIGPLKGMAPEQVVGSAGAAATAGPAVGYEHNGYRFKGGDPNKQSSWEKIGP